MKIYTQTGDQGKTSLLSGERVSKSHIRIKAYGSVDELNALLGVLETMMPSAPSSTVLNRAGRSILPVQGNSMILIAGGYCILNPPARSAAA